MFCINKINTSRQIKTQTLEHVKRFEIVEITFNYIQIINYFIKIEIICYDYCYMKLLQCRRFIIRIVCTNMLAN